MALALSKHASAAVLKQHVAVSGSVGAEELYSASGRPEFSQELLQCLLFAQVRVMPFYSAVFNEVDSYTNILLCISQKWFFSD